MRGVEARERRHPFLVFYSMSYLISYLMFYLVSLFVVFI